VFLEERRLHRYAAGDLAEPGRFFLVPWCEEESPYPARHPQEELSDDTTCAVDACGPCAVRHLAREAEPPPMIETDRQLLGRISRVNRGLGEITVALLDVDPDDDQLAQGFRELGQRLGGLAEDLIVRAEELDCHAPAKRFVRGVLSHSRSGP
jgi:hypothetical protein